MISNKPLSGSTVVATASEKQHLNILCIPCTSIGLLTHVCEHTRTSFRNTPGAREFPPQSSSRFVLQGRCDAKKHQAQETAHYVANI